MIAGERDVYALSVAGNGWPDRNCARVLCEMLYRLLSGDVWTAIVSGNKTFKLC